MVLVRLKTRGWRAGFSFCKIALCFKKHHWRAPCGLNQTGGTNRIPTYVPLALASHGRRETYVVVPAAQNKKVFPLIKTGYLCVPVVPSIVSYLPELRANQISAIRAA